MNVIECILSRRSVRLYSSKIVEDDKIESIVRAGISAPSVHNTQPWKFKIISQKETICQVAQMSKGSAWLKSASSLIIVFLNKKESFHHLKDVQSCGAVIQNMLLAAHAQDVSSCWIGDLLDNEFQLKELLQVDDMLELMGVVSIGYKRVSSKEPGRKEISEFII